MGEERDHTLEFGLPPELEEAMGYLEPTDRYEAIEAALAGLTACINGTIAYNALREGIGVEEVSTTVRAPVDLRLLFGIHDTDRAGEMFEELVIDVDVTGADLSDEEVDRIESTTCARRSTRSSRSHTRTNRTSGSTPRSERGRQRCFPISAV
ncbi:OsmC family protein [Natronorarus salvus]|uniref:OsmC family protein n=1 Tax=Natronorarus salvus TaxID=3117733 RepID=UPI002F2653E1